MPRLVLGLTAGLIITGAGWLGGQFAASRPAVRDSAEMTFFPSGRFLREASLGHRHLAADLGWLAAIQYYGKHRRGDRRYPLAPHLFTVITEVDPHFESAYFFASLILTEAGFRRGAEALLKRGCERNPSSWRLRFELGFFHFVITRSYDLAASAFQAAAELPGAPEYPRRFAAAAYQRAGDAETARELWELLAAASENEEIRRMARERLENMETP